MADSENATTSSTPAAAPSAAPAVDAAPVSQTQTSAAPAPAPAATSDAAASQPAAEVKAQAPLLSSEPAAETKIETEVKTETKADEKKIEPEKKPAEAEKTVETKPVEGKEGEVKAETVAEETFPTYEAFALPEGAKLDEKVMGDFSSLLGKLEAAKSDHKKFQEIGQQFVDLYTSRVTEVLQQQADFFVQQFEQIKAKDIETLRNDPVIGGAGDGEVLEKNMRDIVNFIARNGGTKQEVTEFRQLLQERGMDAAPPLVKFINNIKTKLDRYEKEASKMLPGTKPAQSKPPVGKGIMQALYGSGNSGRAA